MIKRKNNKKNKKDEFLDMNFDSEDLVEKAISAYSEYQIRQNEERLKEYKEKKMKWRSRVEKLFRSKFGDFTIKWKGDRKFEVQGITFVVTEKNDEIKFFLHLVCPTCFISNSFVVPDLETLGYYLTKNIPCSTCKRPLPFRQTKRRK